MSAMDDDDKSKDPMKKSKAEEESILI